MNIFFDRIKYYCCFYDSYGKYIGKKEVFSITKTFTYQGNEFIFKSDCPTFLKLPIYQGPILTGFSKFFFYNFDNPEPIQFKPDYKPLMNAHDLGFIINSKKLEELNQLANEDNILMKILKSPIFWVIIVAVVVSAIYFYQKGVPK